MEAALKGVTKSFGTRTIIKSLDLTIPDGSFMVLLGPSGCGKTTTLRMLAGFETPDSGTITIGPHVVYGDHGGRVIPANARGVGMVFQSYAVWPHMTVTQNVEYPLKIRKIGKQERRAKVAGALELVGLGDQASKSATELSGGQMQRVSLARALVYDPKLLLLDEPLSNLDLKMRERLRIELKAIQQRTGVTSVYVTHDQTEALELGDRIVVLNDGVIQQEGTPQELWNRPVNSFVADFIGSANILNGTIIGKLGALSKVRTSTGLTLLANGGPFDEGAGVKIIVRQEDVRIVGNGEKADADNYLEGNVRQVTVRGSQQLYQVQTDDGPIFAVARADDYAAPQGSSVTLAVSVDKTRVVAQ